MDIAIIGVAGRFPEAKNIEELYHNLKIGKDSARPISPKRLKATTMPLDQNYQVFSWLDDIDKFDHKFFNLSFAEAQNMDPHQRLILEVVHEMFDSSGYSIDDFNGSNTAVFSGDVSLKYYELAREFDPTLITGNTNASTIGHIARAFNLRGAAMMIDTNCSSTLVAANLACKEIQCGDADHAVVCGARLLIEPTVKDNSAGDNLGIMTNDGKTKSFSEKADGTGAGEAVGAILLKRLDKAEEDNDIIYGVIKGSAVNQEAQLSGSLTAPSSQAQAEVIKKAWEKASVDPLSIAYIEPHGSGTKLGDPIEIQGIDLAYKDLGAPKKEIVVSALKSNIGHTDTMAGLSGLVKVLLSFKHQTFFGSIHFDTPNPFIDFDNSVTYINTKSKPWIKDERFPRRAGVSSFALSGTNVHLILEEGKERRQTNTPDQPQIITVSAKSHTALKANIEALKEFLTGHPEVEIADISHTLNRGRKHYDYRFATVKDNLIELMGELMQYETETVAPIVALKELFFVFSDEVNTDDETVRLFLKNKPFKLAYEACLEGQEVNSKLSTFAFQYACFKMLKSVGVETKNMLGIGIGRAVLDVIANQKTLAEGLEIASKCETTEIPELDKRLRALVDREKAKARVAFIEIGVNSTLINGLKNIAIEGKDQLYTTLSVSSINEFLSALYLEGYAVDWKKAHAADNGKKINLPGYQFDPVRCWLREEGDDEPIAQNVKQTHSADADYSPVEPKVDIDKNWTPTEQIIAGFWVEVLKLDDIKLEDDFFKLGGHSLLATQLIARIEAKFGCRLQFKNVAVFSTVKLLASAVDELVEKGEGLFTTQITKAPDAGHYPLSNAQIRLWILHQFEDESTNYNLPGAMILEGEVDISRFENAFQKLIARHESLRTIFKMVDGKPAQIIQDEVDFAIVESTCDGDRLTEKTKDFIQPFDLGKAPLLRVELSKFESGKYLFLFDIHHIISDGISQDLLVSDFIRLYQGETLAPLEIQYRDYAVWQNGLFASNKMSEQESYWVDRFSDELPILNLPYDFKRPLNKSFRGSKSWYQISEKNTTALKALAKEMGVTPYMMLLGIYNILLSKFSGSEDIIVGSPVAGRSQEVFEPILGMFVNTLAMRNFPNGSKTFDHFLEEVKLNATDAYANQDYPFESLVDQLNIERDMGRTPLFDTMFSFQSSFNSDDPAPVVNKEFAVKPFKFAGNTAKFDMVLEVFDQGNSFNLNMEYCIDLFTADTIERFFAQFENIIEQVVQNPAVPLSGISVLNEQEINQLTVDFNQTEHDFGIDQPISQVFELCAETFKDRPALSFKNEILTYKELNEQANQIANTLLEKGYGKGDIIGVITEPSIEMIVATWGVIKSGATFLPIDSKYPAGRIAYILKESKSPVILTCVSELSLTGFAGDSIDLRDKQQLSSNQVNPKVAAGLDDVAYIIFTSGSTGQPKGVEVQHKALLNLCYWHIQECEITEQDNCGKYAGFGFDASISEIFPNFLAGACLHVIPAEIRLEFNQLADFFDTNNISVSFLPTQIGEQFMQYANESLRVLFLGGDELKTSQDTPYKVKNYYGPSENTVVATCFTLGESGSKVMIGKPVANNQVYVLDQYLKPVPVGVTGELYISGANLAKGYLNRPEETAKKFITNPFIEGERLYKSGDLARWRADGNLEFLGRTDHQVKIRGNRVELGEIEQKITGFSGVESAVVTAIENNAGEKVLSGYIVADTALDMEAVKSFLSTRLPDYMVPPFLQQIESVPLNANGKINKKALPDPKESLTLTKKVKPTTTLEQDLARIWGTILGIETVGITDHFFEIGGNSLSAATFLGQVHKKLGYDIKLRQFFQSPTIKGVANAINSGETSEFVSITPVETQERYLVSAAQQRMYLLYKLNPGVSAYNIPGVVKIKGQIDTERLEGALQILGQRHDSLRTYFEEDTENIYQKVKDEVTLEIICSQIKRDEVEKAIYQFIRPFELEHAPLFRMGLATIGENEHILMFDMHHIISDGTSVEILVPELAALYDHHILDPVKIQYKDFSHWQNELFESAVFQKQENFWLDYLDTPPILNMPTDFLRPSEFNPEGSSSRFQMSLVQTEGLKKISQTYGCTDFMTLLAAFNVLLYKYSSQEDIVVGTPVAGRHHIDLEETVGMFVNTLALRNYPEGDYSFEEFLTELKENTIEAFENQDYQFDRLVDQLKLERDPSRNPIFDVMFIYQNIENKSIEHTEIGNWKIEPYVYESEISKFDLTFDIIEGDNGLMVDIEYATKLFKKETINQLFDHFSLIVDTIIEDQEVLLRNINLLSKKEEEFLLQMNLRENETLPQEGFIQRFEAQVKAAPDNIALKYKGEEQDYKSLNEKANQLAWILKDKGVETGQIVAIVAEPSFEMIYAILGVLKAGATYLPIDTSYPGERVNYIIENSQASICLTQSHLSENDCFDDKTVLLLDDPLTYSQNASNLNWIPQPDDLAYVFYTSGSTGTPKGVMIRHESFSDYVNTFTKTFELKASDTILQHNSFAFDSSIDEIFTILSVGGTLLLPKDRKDLEELKACITSGAVTSLHISPLILNFINEEIDELGALRFIVVGGDEMKPGYYSNLIDKVKIYNSYGPTEATVTISEYEVQGNEKEVPIGKPIHNRTVYILDENNQLLPNGSVGELCVGGPGVAVGYLFNEELTQEKFIPNPYKPGEIIYKTGDLAKWLPDGNLAFLGRIDDQVKIRGYRIELGEIEYLLKSVDGIKNAVVLAQLVHDEKELVGYYIAGNAIDSAELKNHLRSVLPEYMVPSFWIKIDHIPLTENGKMDKKAFPKVSSEAAKKGVFVAPATSTEKKMVDIWLRILKIHDKISVTDNFFELGGQSLKASSLVSVIHKELGITVPLMEVFKRPTIKDLSYLIDSTEKSGYSAIKPVEKQAFYPLSAAQKRTYVLNEFAPESTQYNISTAIEINSEAEPAKFEKAFQTLIERHESLRTSFELIGEEVVQVVKDHAPFKIEYQSATDDTVDTIVNGFIRPFNLAEDTLLRVLLVKVTAGKQIMVIDIHHIIADGVSIQILTDEFVKAYEGIALAPLALQYKDYSSWQHQLFQSDAIKVQAQYWLNQFEGDLPVLNLNTDYPRPSVQRFEGSVVNFELNEQVTKRVKALAADNNSTTYMVLLAVYNVFLAKYSGQDDIIVGTPIAGRPHADLQNLIGMFVNTLALRNNPADNKGFTGFLNELTKNTLTSFDYLDFPFEELVEQLNLKREASRNPLFDTMFSFFSEAEPEDDLKGLNLKPYPLESQTAKFDLQLDVTDYQQTIQLGFTYSTNLFKAETIEQFASHFQSVLNEILDDPMVNIGEIEVVTPAEAEQITAEFNDTNHAFNHEATLHQLFEMQVDKAPDAIALTFEGQTMSYAVLNEKSNQLAHQLRAKNVTPDTIIGLMAGRSFEMVTGMLGILKAGGAYLPIDPSMPPKRLAYVLKDSNCEILLTDKSPDLAFNRTIFDLTDEGLYTGLAENPEPINTVNDLAYIIYTSGSTGEPKGVMLEHQGVVNRIEWMKTNYGFTERDVVLQKTPYHFDVSVWEFFMTLCYGGRLVLCQKEVARNVELLVKIVESEQISMIHFVPSMFNAFLTGINADDISKLSSLQHIFTSGEALSLATVKQYHSVLNAKLHNLYGPTEASIDVSYFETSSDDDRIPIGQPIWNTKLYVLNKNKALQPIGVQGDLYISGVGLARGYVNKSELTAERFIDHPFEKGAKLYRTGDLARWLPDGNLEFLGRSDFQVKIRGYRIEPGDIEQQLMRLPRINEAVVADQKHPDGSLYLSAYLITEGELNITEIKQGLAANLPDYMIPSHYIKMSEMPLNSSGKLDRKALPLPAELQVESSTYEAPVTEMEKKLVELWHQIFDLETIGINDNFFDIGGDSIKTIQLNALLLREKLKLEIAKIFQYPRIKDLAHHVTQFTLDISQDLVEGESLLTPIQSRFFSENYKDPHHYNQSIMLEKNGAIHLDKLSIALQSLLEHHDALRLTFKVSEAHVKAYHAEPAASFNLEVADVTNAEDITAEIEKKATAAQSSFDLENGPLFKVVVFHTGEKDYVLLIAHHLVVDVVSWRILIEDLTESCQQLESGNSIQLQDKTHSYQYWAGALHAYAKQQELSDELTYWKAQETIDVSPLPVDFDQKPVKSTEQLDIQFTEIETAQILYEINAVYQTEVLDVLLTALGLSLKKWSGHNKARINVEGHGREQINDSIELSRTVGWFTSIFPFVLDASGANVSEVIKTTRYNRSEIPNKGIGYGVLKYLTDQTLDSKPEIMFNYLGQIEQGSEDEKDQPTFGLSAMPVGETISSRNFENVKLNITSVVQNGRLHFSVEYSSEQYQSKTIEKLGQSLKESLKDIITHCLSKTRRSLFDYDASKVTPELETLITTPIFPLKDAGAKRNVFFFPPAIGFSMIYQELANKIEGYNSYGINFLEQTDRMVYYTRELVKINGDQPFVFVGYSGGANLAYHVATELEKQGHVVSDIIMFDGMLEMDKREMSDDQMRDKVYEYIGEEKNHPSHQLLKTKPERDRVRIIVEAYQHFLNQMLNNGNSQANIHQIKSIQDWEEGNIRKEKWKEVTSGTFKNYQGVGEHKDMLFDQNLILNFRILETILTRIMH